MNLPAFLSYLFSWLPGFQIGSVNCFHTVGAMQPGSDGNKGWDTSGKRNSISILLILSSSPAFLSHPFPGFLVS